MISEKMRGYVENSSAIRAMFEEGKKMADQFGAENVYDFSLGNPNVPAPAEVKNAIEEILKNSRRNLCIICCRNLKQIRQKFGSRIYSVSRFMSL